jgi:hypothetical protein
MQSPRLELHDSKLDRESYTRLLRRESHRRSRRLIMIIAICAVIYACLVRLDVYASGSLGPVWRATPAYVLGAFWYWLCFWHLPSRVAKNPMNRFQFGSCRIAIDNGLMYVQKGDAFSAIPLRQVVKVSKHDSHYILYTTSTMGILVARSAFASSADEAEFERRLAAAHTEAAA